MKKLSISLFALLTAFTAHGQFQNIRISDYNGANEPTICINPYDTRQIMAGANINRYYYSQNGGYTWLQGILTEPVLGVWGDPVIIADTQGDFYYFHLSNPPTGSWIDRIVCQKFNKNTGIWGAGTHMGLNGTKAQDKEWAVVNRTNNHIYVTWTQFDQYGITSPTCYSNIMFSKSTDTGQSWSPAVQINEVSGDCVDSDNTTEGAVPAVGPNGEIYVSWSGPVGIVFDRSADGGVTWLIQDIFVTAQPGGWNINIPGVYRCNGMPVTKCDLSDGPHHGTIYINYSDQSNGANDTDVWLVKSTDGGLTWTLPVRVNNDPPGKHQFFTWMDIDQTTGYLYFVFYDRRNYNDNQTDVYMAVSRNGGESFENILISESPFTPWASVFFGDYNNISSHNGIVRPIWTRMDNGSRSIWVAIADMNVGIPDEPMFPFNLEQNYPNPFQQTTYFGYKVIQPGRVHLAVYDQLGRMVAVLENNTFIERGRYEVFFDASAHDLAPGVYYFGLRSQDHFINRKMVVASW
ncbi:MAG: hypothetical protein U1C46_09180 [Bacteroidales bacterium]|nr:hypothetical protein [Bacteroidales bacterium]